jgi:hypothetical protein
LKDRIRALFLGVLASVVEPIVVGAELLYSSVRVKSLRLSATLSKVKTLIILRAYFIWSKRSLLSTSGLMVKRTGASTAFSVGFEIIVLIIFLVVAVYVAAYTLPGALTAMATSALTSVNTGIQTLFQVVVSLIAVVALILLLIGAVRRAFL